MQLLSNLVFRFTFAECHMLVVLTVQVIPQWSRSICSQHLPLQQVWSLP